MIELKDIVVKFGDFEALHNINVNVKEGEFFTFLGPSGCGKGSGCGPHQALCRAQAPAGLRLRGGFAVAAGV